MQGQRLRISSLSAILTAHVTAYILMLSMCDQFALSGFHVKRCDVLSVSLVLTLASDDGQLPALPQFPLLAARHPGNQRKLFFQRNRKIISAASQWQSKPQRTHS